MEGVEAGKTKLTISPAKTSGNSYKYKTSASAIAEPEYDENLSSWTSWDGTSEITATNGNYIAVAETSSNKCRKFGQTTVKTLLATSTAGSYNSGTGVWTDGATYTLTQEASNNIKATGTIPYEEADAVLGLPAGNRFSVRLVNSAISSQSDLPSGTIVKVSNPEASGGFNTYDKTAFETDGSLIVIVNAPANSNTVIVKVTWTAGNESTYTYDLSSATRASE